jgi:hypothetical protein
MDPLDSAITACDQALDLLDASADVFRLDQWQEFKLALKTALGVIQAQLDAIAAAAPPAPQGS